MSLMSLKPLLRSCHPKTSLMSLKPLLSQNVTEFIKGTSLTSTSWDVTDVIRATSPTLLWHEAFSSLSPITLGQGQNPFPQYVRAFLTTNSIWRKSIHNLVSANQQRMQLMLTLRIDHKALLSSPCNILMHCKPKQCNADAHTHSEETIKLFSLYSLCNAPCSGFQW